MKIKLTTIDKLMVIQLMPQSESILVQTIAREIIDKVKVTQKEQDVIELKPTADGKNIVWNIKKVAKTVRDIEFTDAEILMLQEQVNKFDKAKKIGLSMLDTCLKIRKVEITKKDVK